MERLNTWISQGVQKRRNPEHQHEQTDDDPYGPLDADVALLWCCLHPQVGENS